MLHSKSVSEYVLPWLAVLSMAMKRSPSELTAVCSAVLCKLLLLTLALDLPWFPTCLLAVRAAVSATRPLLPFPSQR